MRELMSALTDSFQAAPPTALAAAFVWGVLSVALSPCHLTSLALMVAWLNGQSRMSTGRAVGLSGLFALGTTVSVAAIGGLTALAGRMAGDTGGVGNYVAAALFFGVGLLLLDALPASWSSPQLPGLRGAGWPAALLLGTVTGAALGPCTFAFVAPLLAVSFAVAAGAPGLAALLFVAFAVGHALVIVAAGSSTRLVQRLVDRAAGSRAPDLLKKASGVLVLLAGLYLVYSA